MGDNSVAWAVSEATDSGTRIYPYCMNLIFESQSLWRDISLSLDTVKRALVLPETLLTPNGKPYPL